MVEIPTKILRVLKNNPGIGRTTLANKFDIGERKAQKYITQYRTVLEVENKELSKNLNLLTESLIKTLQGKKIVDDKIYKKPFSGKIKEQAGLILSDSHLGKKNIFYDLYRCENVTTYNIDIAIKTAELLLKGIYKIINLLKNSYDIEKLNIICVGDLLDNDIIYKGQRFFIDAAVGDQLWLAVKLFTDFINELLEVFKLIEIVSVPGNHGRKGMPEASPSSNNFDYHLMRILDVVFKNNDRINFIVPNSWNYVHTIYDWKYYIHHGNDVYSWMSLPYYGITRKSTKRMNELQFDREIIGHFHTAMRIPISSKAETIVNGCWIDRENYAWEKFGVYSKATQKFFGINPDRPETWSFELDEIGFISQSCSKLWKA